MDETAAVRGSILLGLTALALFGCGSSNTDLSSDDGGKSDASLVSCSSPADCPPEVPRCGADGLCNNDPIFPDSSVEAAPACQGIRCNIVNCNNGNKTTLTGTVYDPAGKNPLYNVVVYVPNAPLDPIKHGPVCDSCGGANVSGNPIATALTDAKGHFKLEDVPVGSSIPLVIQAGKWRRQVTVPNVPQCTTTAVDPKLTRLPAIKSEGDMPLIALAAGCDPIHTLVQKIGVDVSEITDEKGGGMVQVFAGKNNQNGGIKGATDAYAFWGNKAKMMKYDIIINECECLPYPRDSVGPGYANMAAYLNAGGRVFASHYHLNFYGELGKADTSLQNAATWTLWGGSSTSSPYLIDTSFPKGEALDEWLFNLSQPGPINGYGSAWAPGVKTTPKGQIQTSNVGDIGGAKPGLSQRWIYPQGGGSVSYISINMPTNVPADQRCGRAVGSDIHVGNGQLTNMTEQEAALEFMFFDLASCVIDDGKVPEPPPIN